MPFKNVYSDLRLVDVGKLQSVDWVAKTDLIYYTWFICARFVATLIDLNEFLTESNRRIMIYIDSLLMLWKQNTSDIWNTSWPIN